MLYDHNLASKPIRVWAFMLAINYLFNRTIAKRIRRFPVRKGDAVHLDEPTKPTT